MIKRFLLCLIVYFVNLNSYAENSPYSLGIDLGYGGQEFKLNKSNVDSGDELSYGIYGRYAFSHNWGLEAGYIGGNQGVGSILISPLIEFSQLHFDGARVGLYGQKSLVDNLYGYASFGITYQRIAYQMSNIEKSINDVGGFIKTGFEYQFDFGLGINLGAMYIPSEHMKLSSLQLGLLYKF